MKTAAWNRAPARITLTGATRADKTNVLFSSTLIGIIRHASQLV
jgi:hypothetical protein